ECAAAQAQEPESAYAGSDVDDPAPVNLDPGPRALGTGRRESRRAGALGKDVIRDLVGGHLDAFHLWIFPKELLRQKPAIRFQIISVEIQRFPLDEILH